MTTKARRFPGGVQVLKRRAPRPWTVRYTDEQMWHLVDDQADVLAVGFSSMWKALEWAALRNRYKGKP